MVTTLNLVIFYLTLALNEIFNKLKSDYLRMKFFENSDTLFRSESFYIGSQRALDNISKPGAPGIKLNPDLGQKCSLELKLKKFLELPNVYNDISNYIIEETSRQTVITSVIQGRLWKNIQNSFQGKVIFPLLLFYDDFEPCNALGSRAAVYKIGAVYVSLACLPPEFTSLQENVFLYQLFYTSDKQFYGNEKLFSSLINDLKKLESQGVDLCINNEKKKVYFPLLLILGDNLGLNSILGFSESFNADYFCRICVTHRNVTRTETDASKFIFRITDNYQLHAAELSHGVKEKCIWNDLMSFHVTRNKYCDLMHDVFEGILRYDMAYLINHLINKKYFDLNRLNSRIQFFKFSKADIGNAMPSIKHEHLKEKQLIMSASEMLSLSVYFGILVGDLVPQLDPAWTFYLILREMIELLLSRSFTLEKTEYLRFIIEEHQELFIKNFNETLKPKYHFLLHYPELILDIGPPRNLWCMKYEAYHKKLKSTVHSTTCRKNLLVTLFSKDSLQFSQRLLSKKGFTKRFDFNSLQQSWIFLNYFHTMPFVFRG